MAVQLKIEYDQLAELVEQLPEDQQRRLVARLLGRTAGERTLTAEEKIRLFEAAQLSNPVNETPSPRREDWYGDDGR
jgi:dihydrodipicolinate synthase/N-acetylneuraminate lyase